jgi:8-oxo-dGTP pyrophosphatase MutT (NUDIX family)
MNWPVSVPETAISTSDLSPVSAEQFAQMLAGGAASLRAASWGDHRENPHLSEFYRDRSYRDAAVLVPIVDHAQGATVLFTYRAAHLKKHAGQISFPGGKIDEGDAGAREAALRELHEEVGIKPSEVNVIGAGPHYRTGSGFRIFPIFGIVPAGLSLTLNAGEVDSVFEVPLAHLLESSKAVSIQKDNLVKGFTVNTYEIVWEEHRIWGITAAIVNSLRRTLFEDWKVAENG